MIEFFRDVGGPVAIAELISIGLFLAMFAIWSGLGAGAI